MAWMYINWVGGLSHLTLLRWNHTDMHMYRVYQTAWENIYQPEFARNALCKSIKKEYKSQPNEYYTRCKNSESVIAPSEWIGFIKQYRTEIF